MMQYGLDLSGSRYGLVEGCSEHGNKLLATIECWESL
jgi:hypothetical protein